MGDSILNNYISRFPGNFNEYLSKKNHLEIFLSKVKKDYTDLTVYRGVHDENELTKEDFFNTIDTAVFYGLDRNPHKSIDNFGVSVNEEISVLELAIKFPNKDLKLYAIAKGTMKCCCGPATFDGNRPHHNWYIFSDCLDEAVSAFEIVKRYERV